MKYLLIISTLFLSITTYSQIYRINPHEYDQSNQTTGISSLGKSLCNDTTYDIKFYHLDIEIALDSSYIQGRVNYLVSSQIIGLTSLKLDLDSAFTVDSVSFPASTFSFLLNVLTINFSTSYNIGDTFSFSVFYKGVPVLAGGYKGLRYETHDEDELIIVSLSTPYLAHTWWPCKDGTEDKADSTYIDITIKDTVVSSIPVIALSNGLLYTVETNGNKKTYKWKHYYPIVPYYIMVAISNYEYFQQTYTGTDYSFPIDYYVFESHLADAQIGVADIPDVMEFFTTKFGPYPFLQEKYGMTQLGFYGAIENQTNTIINNMGINWFYVSVHELAHSWFADMITCQTWHHGWLNEGFATYSEALYIEHVYGFSTYQDYMQDFEFYDGGTVYLEDVSDPFNVFQPIIYNKGAYVLHMLRRVLGDTNFFDAIYNYATNESFKYKLATTEDFQMICEEESGQDLDYFFDQWIYDERYPWYFYNYDYDQTSGTLEIAIVQTQGAVGWREIFTMPMDIKVEFEGGTDTIVKVLNNSSFQNFTFNFDEVVTGIELDPNDWILKITSYDPSIIVGIQESKQSLFEVYPNPNNGSFTVKIPPISINTEIHLSICDLSGKIHFESIVNSNEKQTHEIRVKNLETGLYFINLRIGNESFYNKIVVLDLQ